MAAFDINIDNNSQTEVVVYNTLYREFRVKHTSASDRTSPDALDIERFREELKRHIDSDPQTVTILPTTNCNARCWYCYEHGIQRHNMTHQTAEQATNYIKNMFTRSELTVNWFGGEPLLNFNVIESITDRLKRFGYQLSTCVTTNGSLLNEQIIAFFKKNYKKLSMCITIDDVDEFYSNIKNYIDIPKDQAFCLVINNIKLLFKYNVFVLIRINFEDIEKAKQVHQKLDLLFKMAGGTSYHIYYAPVWDKNKKHNLADAKNFLLQMRNGHNLNVLANPYFDNIVLTSIANEKRWGHCTCLSKNKVVINADGKLYRCHSLVCDEKYACGDVKTGLDTNAFGYTIFEEKIEQKCGGCALLPICSTQCKLRSLLYGEDNICRNTKQIIPEIAKMKWETKINLTK